MSEYIDGITASPVLISIQQVAEELHYRHLLKANSLRRCDDGSLQ